MSRRAGEAAPASTLRRLITQYNAKLLCELKSATLDLAHGMGAVSFEDEPVSTPLCGEPSLAQLGTIVEAKEGSTSGESETETVLEPPECSPQITTTPSTLIKQQTEGIVDKTAIPLQHPDIDGGWAWVVLFAMFCVFSINTGLLCTTGMYFVQMLTEFGKSRSYTAWMGSLVNAFFMLGGPISSMFIRRWGCRRSLMLGSVLMVMGYLASAFATSLEMLFVTYGIIVGRLWLKLRSIQGRLTGQRVLPHIALKHVYHIERGPQHNNCGTSAHNHSCPFLIVYSNSSEFLESVDQKTLKKISTLS